MSSPLQNKILNFEVTPPAGVWEKIAKALAESELTLEFPSKLYDAEVMPAVSVWDKIKTSLDEKNEAVIPERRRLPFFFKYAAAAVVIGLVAWGGVTLLNNNSGTTKVAKLSSKEPEKDNFVPTDQVVITPTENIPSNNSSELAEERRNDAALEASKKTYAKLDMPVKNRIKEIAAGYHFTSSIESGNISETIQHSVTNVSDLANCYIMLMTPEGHIIRMSKKLDDLVCCVSGEDVDEQCKDQMKKWREKIVSSPASHSTGGFLDVLGLVRALQD